MKWKDHIVSSAHVITFTQQIYVEYYRHVSFFCNFDHNIIVTCLCVQLNLLLWDLQIAGSSHTFLYTNPFFIETKNKWNVSKIGFVTKNG